MAPYTPPMHPARIAAVLSAMKPEELRDAYGFIDVFERFGTMSRADADATRLECIIWSSAGRSYRHC